MRRIDVALDRLQIVALHESLMQKAMLWRCAQKLVAWEERRLALTHIGEDEAGALGDRISQVLYLVLVPALRRLGRLLEAASIDVVKPAVIEAA